MKQRGFAVVELLLAAAAVSSTLYVLSPLVARTRSERDAAVCQRNLRIIGVAMSLYAEDYGGSYPTNKPSSGATSVYSQTFLTSPGDPQRMLTWVEGLERYFARSGVPGAAAGKVKDKPSPSLCPETLHRYFPTTTGVIGGGYGDCRVSYAGNHNVMELRQSAVEDPTRTLAFRELGLQGQSHTIAIPSSSPKTRPSRVFLTDSDTWQNTGNGATTARLDVHAQGSHFLLADGHVRWHAHSVARGNLLRNDHGSRPGDWFLPDPGDTEEALLWITP